VRVNFLLDICIYLKMSDKQLPNNQSWNKFWAEDAWKCHEVSWSKKRMERIIQSCEFIPGSILDAGCGSGYFSKMFLDFGWDVIAVDYSSEALHMVRRKTGGKVTVVQAEMLGL
jgi:2-polyprenyl-3-methyl-5-hydroxy-6-metoxy-1,4-benzoquinol methylase